MPALAFCIAIVCILSYCTNSAAGEPSGPAQANNAPSGDEPTSFELSFQSLIKPLLKRYCLDCHNQEIAEGDLNLSSYQAIGSVARDHRHWAIVAQQISQRNMPPESADQPNDDERTAMINWIREFQSHEAARDTGNPGPVLARRLSNAEFDYTIRDLTGVDIRPTREFPVDPANEAGFDNTGESLMMTPSLLNKYLEAAQSVAAHLVLMPDRFEFAPFPVVADTDLDKFCVNRIIDFYNRQPIDYKDYFLASWVYQHRHILGNPNATIDNVAQTSNLSPKYLATIYGLLTQQPGEHESIGPIAALRAMWQEMPAPTSDNQVDAKIIAQSQSKVMRDFVIELRTRLVPFVPNLTAPTVNNGSQPLVLWKNRQFASNRQRFVGGALKPDLADLPANSLAAQAMVAPDDLDAAAVFQKSFDRFCYLFPDAFMVTERARVYLDPEKEKSLKGRYLSAGFHNQMGYFRDDAPLYDLILGDADRLEIDRLWEEFYFAASIPLRQYSSFIWFERAESGFLRDEQFDFARAEDKDCASPEKIARLSVVYQAKAKEKGASDVAMAAIDDYFRSMHETFRHHDSLSVASQEYHLKELLTFAERAFRRPLTSDEQSGMLDFYTTLRISDALEHDEAIRDCVVAILVSPNFCYRVDVPVAGNDATRPLSDLALASRLSYFLWSSMPDNELIELAKSQQLRKPDVLKSQTVRMLKDPKARALAIEFGGNWLDFRRFDQHNAVDRQRFSEFDNDLRQAMFEEPIRYLVDVFQQNGNAFDLVQSDHMFVNRKLAKHYGLDVEKIFGGPKPKGLKGDDDVWIRVDNAKIVGRGGLLAMAVFLTKNAPGLRTSPVKRGYWVARRLLGEYIPPPPNDVPELPADESKLGELTLRDALKKHRENKACASCHERFDSLGLAFESFDPIGQRRQADLGGKPMDDGATFPDGVNRNGLNGLVDYITQHRRDDFANNLSRSLMSYALGRSLLLSDEPTLTQICADLAGNEYRFHTLIQSIVTSPQFLNKRMTD
ncbi:MAG TPA: hypothetical protein DDZ51_23900 [Planctomycetaceae bacterium]|nr:hypothetical protein [Planctomycetaceae bacterium]